MILAISFALAMVDDAISLARPFKKNESDVYSLQLSQPGTLVPLGNARKLTISVERTYPNGDALVKATLERSKYDDCKEPLTWKWRMRPDGAPASSSKAWPDYELLRWSFVANSAPLKTQEAVGIPGNEGSVRLSANKDGEAALDAFVVFKNENQLWMKSVFDVATRRPNVVRGALHNKGMGEGRQPKPLRAFKLERIRGGYIKPIPQVDD